MGTKQVMEQDLYTHISDNKGGMSGLRTAAGGNAHGGRSKVNHNTGPKHGYLIPLALQ